MAFVSRIFVCLAAASALVSAAFGQAVKEVKLSPSSVIGGGSAAGSVDLESAAIADVSVKLTSSSASAKVPATVKVLKGSTSASFNVTTTPVAQDVSASITAGSGSSSKSATLTVLAPVVSALTISPASIAGGGKATGTFTLTAPAPTAGIVVNLTSSSPSAVTPSSVTVAKGKTGGTFTINTSIVAADVPVTVTATTGSTKATAKLTVLAPVITTFTVAPIQLNGGGGITGSVTIGGNAPTGGLTIALSSNTPAAAPPATLLIPAGARKATFAVKTLPVAVDTQVQIAAKLNGVSTLAKLTLLAPKLSQVTLSTNSVVGGLGATGSIALNAVAPVGGLKVAIESGNPAAIVPATVTVPAGKNTANFGIQTTEVPTSVSTKITCSVSGSSISLGFTVQARAVAKVTFKPPFLIGGKPATATVTLNKTAAAGGFLVKLRSVQTSATVPATVLVEEGSITATFSVATKVVTRDTTVTISATDPNGVVTNAPITLLAANGLAPSAWPKARGNAMNTGQGLGQAPVGKLSWTTAGAYPISSRIALDASGNLHFATLDQGVFATSPTGQSIYSIRGGMGGPYQGSPSLSVLPDGTSFIGLNTHLVKYGPTGLTVWVATLSNTSWLSTPAVAKDGTIYTGDLFSGRVFALNADGSQKWTYQTRGQIVSSATIGSDGTIYIGSADGILYALSPAGSLVWKFQSAAPIESSPTIGPDGTIYVGSDDFNLYAINPNGTQKWAYKTSNYVYSTPALGSDGTVYVGSFDKSFYAINPNGTKKWSYLTGNIVAASPAIATDGTVYVGSADGNLYAFDPTGNKKWAYATSGSIVTSPSIGADGTVYTGSADDALYAITPAGQRKWWKMLGTIGGTPAIAVDGTLYYSAQVLRVSGKIDCTLAMNPNGTTKWVAPVTWAYNTPAIAASGTIYIGSGDNKLYALNADGTTKWSYDTGDSVECSPAIGLDGTIYFSTYGATGGFFALNPDGTLKWKYASMTIGGTTPVIGPDGTIYFADARLTAFSPDGNLKWQLNNGTQGAPAVGTDGTIYAPNALGLDAINPNGTTKWSFKTSVGGASSPAIGPNGAIYWGSADGNLYAFNPDGSRRWTYHNGGVNQYDPIVGPDGTIYFWSYGNDLALNALTTTGKLKWKVDFDAYIASPVMGSDGSIYLDGLYGIAVIK